LLQSALRDKHYTGTAEVHAGKLSRAKSINRLDDYLHPNQQLIHCQKKAHLIRNTKMPFLTN
jgi:deoxyhypusine synthase